VLQQLNQYLFQFRSLTLPQFGTIRLVAQAARLDVVEHLIYPPAYQPQFVTNDKVSSHQLEYFATALQQDVDAATHFLTRAGQSLKSQVQAGALDWSGIGTFEYNNQQIHFNPQASHTLAPVPAKRVMREGAQHTVLVGDQVVIGDASAEVAEEESRDYKTIAAWIIAVLALLFIAYILYQNEFSPQASGSQTKVQPAPPHTTWQ
jgi:hypothetical protein